jgi:NADH dehydrogenase
VWFLIGFRNRVVVLIDWAWAYLTFQRYARIVANVATVTNAPGGTRRDER